MGDDGELIAAESSTDTAGPVGSGTQPKRHGRQHRVPGIVAARVVDLLEPVQVEQHYCLSAAPGHLACLAGPRRAPEARWPGLSGRLQAGA